MENDLCRVLKVEILEKRLTLNAKDKNRLIKSLSQDYQRAEIHLFLESMGQLLILELLILDE